MRTQVQRPSLYFIYISATILSHLFKARLRFDDYYKTIKNNNSSLSLIKTLFHNTTKGCPKLLTTFLPKTKPRQSHECRGYNLFKRNAPINGDRIVIIYRGIPFSPARLCEAYATFAAFDNFFLSSSEASATFAVISTRICEA